MPPAPSSGTYASASEIDSESFTVTSRVDGISTQFIEESAATLTKLIQSKVELHRHKNALEDQIDWLKHQTSTCDTNITVLQEENSRLEVFVRESQGSSSKEINEDNLDTLVHPSDPFS
jgi:peptidoglycan hydrolase CwlO-like protein